MHFLKALSAEDGGLSCLSFMSRSDDLIGSAQTFTLSLFAEINYSAVTVHYLLIFSFSVLLTKWKLTS